MTSFFSVFLVVHLLLCHCDERISTLNLTDFQGIDEASTNSTEQQSNADDSKTFLNASTSKDRAPLSLNDTEFILFTSAQPGGKRIFIGDNESLALANFDLEKDIVIATHGFQASRFIEGQVELRHAYSKYMDVNYFVVDWSVCSNLSTIFYPVAIDCAYVVGGYIAEFIRFLEANGADPASMHLIGHSLGSHAMSQVSNAGIRVRRITGFDPTQVLFWMRSESERLDPSDAEFVDVIHTDARLQGWNKLLGHSDFFPNGGKRQPACGFFNLECNHEMAYHYYAESLGSRKKYPAIQCLTMEDANNGECTGTIAYMGIDSDKSPHGIYYVAMDGEDS